MESTYIERYERNLIQEAVSEDVKKTRADTSKKVKETIAQKMKEDGVSPDFIFKYCGIKL